MLMRLADCECVGVDVSPLALAHARNRVDCPLCLGSVERLPFASNTFDLALSLDVLYHAAVADDVAALRELARVVRPGGAVIINAPAYEALRSSHDRAIHTGRRYTRRELRRKVERAGLAAARCTYWNTLLFAPIALVRLWRRRQARSDSDLRPTPALANAGLQLLLSVERALLRWMDAPFGLSILCVAEKP